MSPHELLVPFIDGPSDRILIDQCLTLLEDLATFIPVTITRRRENLGCDRQILTSLTEVLETHRAKCVLAGNSATGERFSRDTRFLRISNLSAS